MDLKYYYLNNKDGYLMIWCQVFSRVIDIPGWHSGIQDMLHDFEKRNVQWLCTTLLRMI